VISAAFMAFYKAVSSGDPCHTVPSRYAVAQGEETYGQILLVGENQENGVAQLILVEHALELLTGLNNTVTIVGVDDEDDTLGVLEVVPPQGTDLVLTTDIPHGELDVLILDGLDVEALAVLVVGGSYYRRQGLVFSLSERRVR
jgi:hypothetical protein